MLYEELLQMYESGKAIFTALLEQLKRMITTIGDIVIKTKTYYEYVVTISAKNAVLEVLNNTKLLQPFREAKRILALRFIEKDILDGDLVKPVWDWL